MKQKLEHIWEDPGLKKRAENGHTHEEGEFLPRVMLTAGNGFFPPLSHIQIAANTIWLRILHKAMFFDW